MAAARWIAALCCALALNAPAQDAAPLEHRIAVRLDPLARRISASDHLSVPPGPALDLELAARFEVGEIRLDDRALAPAGRVEGALRRWRIPAGEAPRALVVRWSGPLEAPGEGIGHRDTLAQVAPTADPRGSFLPAVARWYPGVAGRLERYRVAIDLPEDQRGLVPGRLLHEETAGGRYRAEFAFEAPGDGIDLMAGPYRVAERTAGSIDGRALRLRSYFHDELAALSGDYLDAVAGYIARYEGLLGAYPFDGFSVVSSPTPTGFGMPSLTYLGIDVIRLPFIRATSLGHEVLHSWWGNGVYPDYARGNWAEGLTTFMADYAYREDQGEAAAREMRLAWLGDFAAVPAGADRPLAEFSARSHGVSQIVGYNKAAFVFLMLRDLVGRDAFDRGLRRFWREQRFRVAGWPELARAFEAEAGRSLAGFFEQWLQRRGAPEVAIESAQRDGARLRVVLRQRPPAYALQATLAVETAGGASRHTVELAGARSVVEVPAPARPVAVSLDPDLRLMRRLAPGEAPPILRQVMLDPATRVEIVSPALAAAGERLAEALLEHPPRPPAESDAGAPRLLIGDYAAVDAWLAARGLAARAPHLAGHGSAQVWAVPGGTPPVVVVSVADAAALAALLRPLPHYGRYSWIVFEGPRAGARGVWPAQAPRRPVP